MRSDASVEVVLDLVLDGLHGDVEVASHLEDRVLGAIVIEKIAQAFDWAQKLGSERALVFLARGGEVRGWVPAVGRRSGSQIAEDAGNEEALGLRMPRAQQQADIGPACTHRQRHRKRLGRRR